MDSIDEASVARSNQCRPTEKSDLKSPKERGLCNGCAQYNWTYHLGRYIDGLDRDDVFIREDAHVTGIVENQKSEPDVWANWYRIENAPYSGKYKMQRDRSQAQFELGQRHSVDPSLRNCSLCGLIIDAIKAVALDPEISVAYDTISPELRTKVHSEEFWFGPISLYLRKPDRRVDSSVVVLEVDIRLQPNSPAQRLKFGFEFVGRGTGAAAQSMIDPNQIDFGQVKHWFETCKAHHGGLCKPDTPKDIPSFKVLDVRTDRIIAGPAGCTYVALSYVWGKTTPFRVRSADFVSIGRSPRSPNTFYAQLDRQKLPRTIQDAMFVVEALGERYIWVDSLCIVADNENEMKIMIDAMDSVYKAAVLTVVAADGGDSESGLACLHPGSRSIRSVTGTVDGFRLGLKDLGLNYQLEKSTWATRGWTYQEYQFSARKLVFINGRVYFECGGRIWGAASLDGTAGRKEKTRSLEIASPLHYMQHVREYSSRSLTFEGDILNAFTAILNDQSAQFGTIFCWGLPTQHFLQSLMWTRGARLYPKGPPLKRRTGSQKGRAPFPSWSWAGWIGKVRFLCSEDSLDIFQYYGDTLLSDLAWPWEPRYRGVSKENDVFESGILIIDVAFASFDHSLLAPGPPCWFDDGTRWKSGSQECFLLARIENDLEVWPAVKRLQTGKRNSVNHIVMAVEQGNNDIYYRKGLFQVRGASWAAAKPECKRIRLG